MWWRRESVDLLRAELRSLQHSALNHRARQAGLTAATIYATLDEDDPHAALVALVVAKVGNYTARGGAAPQQSLSTDTPGALFSKPKWSSSQRGEEEEGMGLRLSPSASARAGSLDAVSPVDAPPPLPPAMGGGYGTAVVAR